MTSVGIVGASGFTGAELLRLCAGHPELEVRVATGDTQAGPASPTLYPSLAAAYPALTLDKFDADGVDGLDLVFLGLPHGASQDIVPDARRPGRRRSSTWPPTSGCTTPALYPHVVRRATHTAPELLDEFAYGLPELFRDEHRRGRRWSPRPGCYSTAAVLALAPLLRAGLVEPTGHRRRRRQRGVRRRAGRPKPTTAFCTVDEDFTAYGLLDHRHTPEIEQA